MRRLVTVLSLLGLSVLPAGAATRLYLTLTDAVHPAQTFAFDSDWDSTTVTPLRRRMTLQKDLSVVGNGTAIRCLDTASTDCPDRQYVSDPIKTADGTEVAMLVKGQMQIKEAATTDDVVGIVALVKVISNTGSSATSYPVTKALYGTNAEFTTTNTNRCIFACAGTPGGATYVINNGDRLLVELGYVVDADGGTTPDGRSKYGEDQADCPEDETTTTACAPWIEFDYDFTFYPVSTPSH